jgi:hypothetical protein
VTRNRDGEPPAAVATAAGDDGVGVAGLDVVRRKTVLRRDETEPTRARPCVGSAGGLSGASTASLSTALAAAKLLGSQRFESAVSCASSNGSRACQRKR